MSKLKEVGKVALIIVLMPLMPFVALASIPLFVAFVFLSTMYMAAEHIIDGCPPRPEPGKKMAK